MKPNLTWGLFRTRAGGWMWRMRARNGKIRADSGEAYTRRRDARRALGRLIADLREGNYFIQS